MKRLVGSALCLLLLGACEFARADEDPVKQLNNCSVASDCTGGAQCMSGLCVLASSDAEFELALQVTPLPVAAREAPHPLLIENMRLDSSMLSRRIDLPLPVAVSGQIRNEGLAIDAALTFTPVHGLSGIASGAVAVSTTRTVSGNGPDYTVQLSSGLEYTLFVRPTDGSLPPWRTTFKAMGQPVSVDFQDLETFEQTFQLASPTDRELLVTAFDANNQPLSSTATFEDGVATLVFAAKPLAYRLAIRAEQAYEPVRTTQPAEGIFCDEETPVYPTYSIASQDLAAPIASGANAGAIEIPLPEPPARVRFEGTIQVCDAGMKAIGTKQAPVLSELPVALSSSALLMDDSPFIAAFEAETTAQLDASTGLLTFCVQLMEGNYDVVVTPPTNLPCGVYAQHRLIEAPPNGVAASGALLRLLDSAVLQGTLQTTDRTPLADIAIEAVALGRPGEIPRKDEDATQLLRYNRSRQATTASDGKFTVPVDLGSYDVLVKPPASSGFAWQVRHDVGVGSERRFSSIVYMPSPVMLTGRLAYMGGGDPDELPSLAGAEVLAFAVVGDKPAFGGDVARERAVPIGKAVAEPDGSFILLLPQTIKPDWEW